MPQDPDFYVAAGDRVTFAKTVSESDVYLFAGITGDLSPVHVNQQLMESSPFGQRIAHGALTVGFMSALSTMIVEQARHRLTNGETPVSLGYDRVRFTAPVLIGDTVTLQYEIADIDRERGRTKANITATNQRGETVAVATDIMKWR